MISLTVRQTDRQTDKHTDTSENNITLAARVINRMLGFTDRA